MAQPTETKMNIEDMTIGQARQISALLNGHTTQAAPASPHIGQKVIIRGYASGVHYGTVKYHAGREVHLTNSRRCWRWDVEPEGISLSELSLYGTMGGRSKVCSMLQHITILDAIEIIPCTEKAAAVIEAAEVAKP